VGIIYDHLLRSIRPDKGGDEKVKYETPTKEEQGYAEMMDEETWMEGDQ